MAAKTVSVGAAARMLGVPPRAVRGACQRGDLRAIRLGSGNWYVYVDAIREAIAERDAVRSSVRPIKRAGRSARAIRDDGDV